MSIMLIMTELHSGLVCGKVNIIYIKNFILLRVIIFLTKFSCAYMYVSPLIFIIACFLQKEAATGALTENSTSVLFVLRAFSLTSCRMLRNTFFKLSKWKICMFTNHSVCPI